VSADYYSFLSVNKEYDQSVKPIFSKVVVSILFIATFLVVTPSAADCAPGEGRGVSVNATTGEQITYCIPAAPEPGVDYNPQTNPSAPPAETVLTREQAAQQRRDYEAAAAAAAAIERDRIAASTPVVPREIDPTDPLPTIRSGEKVPGTEVSGQQEITCPAGSGRGIEVNATTGAVSTSCIKSWTAPEVILQQIAVEESINKSKLVALELSKIWNTENPGQQKCFPYGVVSQTSQLTESGVVCANPISAAAAAIDAANKTTEAANKTTEGANAAAEAADARAAANKATEAAAAIDAANKATEAANAAAEAADARAAAEAANKAALELLAEKFAVNGKKFRNFIIYGKMARIMFAERSGQF
jgi:hypothetical protein